MRKTPPRARTRSRSTPAPERFDCKLGDTVLMALPSPARPYRGRIVEIGLNNEHGHPLNIRIQWESGNESETIESVSDFRYTSTKAIVPPLAEIPRDQRHFLDQSLIFVRVPCSSLWTYELADADTLQRVVRIRRITERSTLHFRSCGWFEKEYEHDCHESYLAAGSRNDIELPDDFDPEYVS